MSSLDTPLSVGVVRRWRSGWFSSTPVALSLMPFFVLALQSYGGEALLRAGVFSAPFVAVNGAFAFGATARRTRRVAWIKPLIQTWRRHSTVIGRGVSVVIGVGMCIALVTARFGNESFEAVSDPDAAAMSWVYENAPLGSTLLSVSRNLPWRYQQLEGYIYHPSGDDVFGNFDQLNGVLGPIYNLDHDAFVIVSPTQSAFAIALYGAKPGWLDNLIIQIEECGPFGLVHESGASRIYRVRPGADLSGCLK